MIQKSWVFLPKMVAEENHNKLIIMSAKVIINMIAMFEPLLL
jgi:hypothetical protein